MAHDTHGASHAKALPADLERTGVRRRLAGAGAYRGSGVCSCRRDSRIPRPVAGPARLGPRAARMGSRHAAHLRLDRRRSRASDGAVLLRRQVGLAASPPARSHDPHAAAGLRLLVVSAIFMKKLYLWAQIHQPRRYRSSEVWPDQRSSGSRLDFKRPMLNPTTYVIVMLALLRHLGLLHVAAQCARPEARHANRPTPRPTGSRSSKTSAAPASSSTRSP